jgi:calcineurin-like phosphoesterase family protein
MSHLEIIKKAYTECGIVFRVWTNPESGYQCLIKTGDRDRDYEHLTYDDEVVNFIGDFSFGTAEQTKEIFGQLKGRKRLIVGNHDKSHSKNWWRSLGFEEVVDSKIIQLGRFEVTLCHYPTGDPKRASYHAAFAQEKEAWLICGHVHEKWRVKGNVINVGVDAWGFCPVMDFQLTQIMEESNVKQAL